MKTNIVSIVIAAVLGGLVAFGAVYGLMHDKNGKTNVIVAVDDIKEIAQLATVEYHISTFVEKTKDRQWFEWADAKYLVFLKGVVTGSVDLNLADIQLPTGDEKTVSIKFKKGAVVVSNPEIGTDDIRLITVSDPNVFNKINQDDWANAQSDAIAALKKSAIDAGIMAQTASEAKVVLSRFLGALGYAAKIEFEDIKVQ